MNNRTVLQMLCFLIAVGCSDITFSGEDKLFEGVDPDVSYSAWRILETNDQRMKIREYHAPNKKRFEMNSQGHDMVMIIRMDKDESWMLIPETKVYMRTSVANINKMAGGDFEVLEQSAVGKEEVNGYATTKYKGTFIDPQGRKASGYFWLTEKYGISIKTDIFRQTATGEEHAYTELTELKMGSQPQSLFDVPDSYRAVPSGMGDIFGIGNSPSAQSMNEINQRRMQELTEERRAQLTNERVSRLAIKQQEKAALSQLTVSYLIKDCWFDHEGQIKVNSDGSYEEGTHAGRGYAMERGGDNIEKFRQRFDGLVSKTENRFVVRSHGRQFSFNRRACVTTASHSIAGSSAKPDQNRGNNDSEGNPEKNVVDKAADTINETADKIKKGLGSLFH